MNLRIFTVISLLLSLGGCASMQAQWSQQSCYREAAYEKGMNDARSGTAMNSGYAAYCPPEQQDQVMAGYRDGYTAGVGSTQQSPPALINVNIGGGNSGQDRGWYCELKPFTDHFEAFGPTQLEAGSRVSHECKNHYDEMFCRSPICRPNQ